MKPIKQTTKRLFFVALPIALVALAIAVCNFLVLYNADGRLDNDAASAPQVEVGLLLGTTPQTRIGWHDNELFLHKLYKAGKIKTILISGDKNRLDGINEVECMRDSLIARRIPKTAFILDGQGHRTLDAVVRATSVYGFHRYIVISQKFHNERALYLAEHLGLDAHDLTAFNAADATSNMAILTYLREYLARVKVFIDIITGK